MRSIKFEVGLKVKLALKSRPEETIEGEVFAWDEDAFSHVILQQTAAAPNQTFRLINTHSISNIEALQSSGHLHQSLGLASDADLEVDEAAIRTREATVLQHARAHAPPLGVGVTEEAQSIFNALHKTLPVEWRGQTIVVLKDCFVDPPYEVISGGTDPLRRQIFKIIVGEKRRIAHA